MVSVERRWSSRFADPRSAYVVAVLAVGLATLLRSSLEPVLGDAAPFHTYYLAVLLAAAAGGLGPGLLATALGAVLGEWLFVEPRGALPGKPADALIRLLVFLIVGTGVSLIAGRLYAQRRDARRQALDLQAMLDLVDLGHLLMRDLDGRIIRWTAGCQRMYGYTAAEAIGRVSQDLLRTEFPLPLETIRQQLFEQGRWEGELVHRHKDGRRVTVASLWALHRDPAGRATAILESNNNISGLRRTEERLGLVLDAARIGTWEWDLQSGALEWSRQCLELFGLAPGTVMTYPRFLEAVLLEDRERVDRCAVEALERRTEFDVELRTVWPDGSVRWIASHGRGYYDASGRPYRMAGAAMDVTERKGADQAVRVSERRFRGTFENAAVGIGHIDLDGRFLLVNERFRQMLGYEELKGRRFLDLTHPEDRPNDGARFASMVRGDRDSDTVEKRYVRADGADVWVLVTRSLQRDEANRPAYAISVVQDITDRKAAEDALRKSEAFSRRIVASSLSGLYIYDLSRRALVYVSPEYTRITGYTLEQISRVADAAFLELFHPDDRARILAHVASATRAGDDEVREIEYRFKTADGRWIWCLSRETVFARGADGSVSQYLGSFLDVTERRQAEEALRESELFYRQTLESIPGMVFTTRPDGYCDYQSQQWVAYTGVPMNEHLGDGWNKLLHPLDRGRALETWRAAVEGRARYDLEYRVRRHDGEYEWFKVVGQPIRDTAGRIVRWFGIALNVEDLKRAESALEAARRAAEDANLAKDRFLAVLSHELRTPLTPAVAALSMLRGARGLDEASRESLEIIRRNVEMEARLIDDLLDVTRIVRGKVELDRRLVSLGDVVGRAVEVCMPDIEARRLHFGLDLGSCESCLIHGDAARLQQIFWNLLQNAIKFTPQGGCVGIRCSPDDHAVLAEVVDSGEGIEPELLPHIFNPFEQGGTRVTRQFGGLGLGLTITRGFVEMHGGEISAHSAGKGQGATFRVRLPVQGTVRAALPAATVPLPAGADGAGELRPARPLRILLVEDHGDTAMMMQWFLAAQGHQVETAGDVASARQLAESRPFDVLVSDLGLPDGTGVELMRSLRERGYAMPGVALSGFGQEEDVRRSKEAGFAAHLTKPASPERLTEVIAAVASRRAV